MTEQPTIASCTTSAGAAEAAAEPVVLAELFPEERLLWYGQPGRYRSPKWEPWHDRKHMPEASGSALVLVQVFAILNLAGASLLPAIEMLHHGTNLICVLASIGSVVRPRRTHYAITDRRMLVIVSGVSSHVVSVPYANVSGVRGNATADSGSGDLVLAINELGAKGERKSVNRTVFVGVDDVRSVEALLLRVASLDRISPWETADAE